VVLGLFDLSDKADAPFQSLSTGQRQRLNLARALVHDPPILFLDEPTKSMDVQTSDFVKELIRDELVARRGKTVVFISHELYEMDNFCDRVAVLAEGRLRAIGSPEDLAARLPRRAVYRIQIEGDPEPIIRGWRALPGVESVAEVSRGVAITSLDVGLVDETSKVWFSVLRQVAECGARVEAYHRVDDRSLREIIKHFSEWQ
jgi:ABC-2 type transport system ATP-binding protein